MWARRHARLKRYRFATGLLLTLSLAFVAGMGDAIGLILVGQYISFMSGNTTELALAATSGRPAEALFLLAIVAAFVFGNAFGEVIMHWTGRHQSVLLVVVAALIALPVAMGGLPWGILPAVIGMGTLNAAIDHVGDHPFGITFVTGALSRFGRGLGRALSGERQVGWVVQLVPWSGMLVGVFAGALLHRELGTYALLAAAATSLLIAALCLLVPVRWRADYTTPARRIGRRAGRRR